MKSLTLLLFLIFPLTSGAALVQYELTSYFANIDDVTETYEAESYLELDTGTTQITDFWLQSDEFAVSMADPPVDYGLRVSEDPWPVDETTTLWELWFDMVLSVTRVNGTEVMQTGRLEASNYFFYGPRFSNPYSSLTNDDVSPMYLSMAGMSYYVYNGLDSIRITNGPVSVPEPPAVALFGLGLLALFVLRVWRSH